MYNSPGIHHVRARVTLEVSLDVNADGPQDAVLRAQEALENDIADLAVLYEEVTSKCEVLRVAHE